MARAGRKRRADGARRNGENWHGRMRKRRADGARQNGKTGTGGCGNVGRMARDETGKRHGRGGNDARMARDETGKLAREDAETSGGWRATKRENWHGRMRKRQARRREDRC